MPPTRRHTPAQELARSGKDFVGASRELMTVDAGDVRAVIRVLLDPAAVDQSDEGPAEIALAFAGEDEWLHGHPSGALPQLIRQERGQAGADPGGVDDQRREVPDIQRQVDELVVEGDVPGAGPGHAGDDAVDGKTARRQDGQWRRRRLL